MPAQVWGCKATRSAFGMLVLEALLLGRIRSLQPHAVPQLAVLHPLLVRLLDVPARVDGGDARGGGRPLQAVDGLADQAAHLAEAVLLEAFKHLHAALVDDVLVRLRVVQPQQVERRHGVRLGHVVAVGAEQDEWVDRSGLDQVLLAPARGWGSGWGSPNLGQGLGFGFEPPPLGALGLRRGWPRSARPRPAATPPARRAAGRSAGTRPSRRSCARGRCPGRSWGRPSRSPAERCGRWAMWMVGGCWVD
eukprot:scaffold279_cov61-Phaeocystis_antarctica.AAC.5